MSYHTDTSLTSKPIPIQVGYPFPPPSTSGRTLSNGRRQRGRRLTICEAAEPPVEAATAAERGRGGRLHDDSAVPEREFGVRAVEGHRRCLSQGQPPAPSGPLDAPGGALEPAQCALRSAAVPAIEGPQRVVVTVVIKEEGKKLGMQRVGIHKRSRTTDRGMIEVRFCFFLTASINPRSLNRFKPSG